jgi:hypothetical protein
MWRAYFLAATTDHPREGMARPYYLLPWISIEMPQDTNWIQENRVAFSARSDFALAGDVALLHRHKRADRQFRKKSTSSFLGQPNAAV